MVYGSVRVSAKDQNEDRQIIAMREVGVSEKKFIWISTQERILNESSIKGW